MQGYHCLSKIWKPGQVGGICTQSGKSRQESKMSQLAWLSRARKPVGQVRRNYYVYMNYWLVRCSIAYTWMVLPLLWKPNSLYWVRQKRKLALPENTLYLFLCGNLISYFDSYCSLHWTARYDNILCIIGECFSVSCTTIKNIKLFFNRFEIFRTGSVCFCCIF